MFNKRSKIISLPTEDNTYISKGKIIDQYFYCPDKIRYNSEAEVYQHLYFVNDEVISAGFKGWAIVTVKDDTRIHYLVKVIKTEDKCCYCTEDRKFSFDYYDVREILVTTNREIMYQDNTQYGPVASLYPRPTDKFVQEYARKGGINEVNLEYNEDGTIYEIDNVVRIELERVYSTEDVIFILHKYQDAISSKNNKFNDLLHLRVDEWAKENLKY